MNNTIHYTEYNKTVPTYIDYVTTMVERGHYYQFVTCVVVFDTIQIPFLQL